MAVGRSDVIVAGVGAVVAAVLTVLVAIFVGNATTAIVTACFSLLATLMIDVRIHQAHLLTNTEVPLVTMYVKLARDKSPLFKRAAEEAYAEAEQRLENLARDRLEVPSLPKVYDILESIFCHTQAVKKIYATSYDEIGEWRDTSSWWGGSYLRIHGAAISRGVQIERVFIVKSEDEREQAREILDRQAQHKISVQTAKASDVSPEDLRLAGNSMLFCDGRGHVIYCLQAEHDSNGAFKRAVISRGHRNVNPIAEAHRDIRSSGTPYVVANRESTAGEDIQGAREEASG